MEIHVEIELSSGNGKISGRARLPSITGGTPAKLKIDPFFREISHILMFSFNFNDFYSIIFH